MLNVFIMIALIFLASAEGFACNQTAEKSKSIILCGYVKEIVHVKSDAKLEHIWAIIEFEIHNNSSRNVLVAPDRVRVIGGKAQLPFHRTFATFATSTIESFNETQAIFDKLKPEINEIFIIKPGEVWKFTGGLNLELDGSTMEPDLIWKDLVRQSPFQLNARISTSDSYLIRNGKPVRGTLFWRRLQDRWKTYGDLLVDDVVSEPIVIDLKSTKLRIEDKD